MAGTHTKEREAVKQAYPSRKWSTKVDKMDDGQVFALYMRLKAQKII